MSMLQKMEDLIDKLSVGKSPVADSWPLMSNPVPIVIIVMIYIAFVLIGPKLMKDRQPMKLDKIIMYYNAVQVILSVLLCYKALSLNLLATGLIHAGCAYSKTTQDIGLLDLGWWYAFAKVTELLDTVFFIVRKKDKQVTFLHVYHHSTMALYAWGYLKFAASGEGAILALLNSAIHIVMYSYYLIAGLGPQYQKYLWWKKYVTTMQIMQFMIMLSYNVITFTSVGKCDYDRRFTLLISFNVSVFLFLFYNFYSSSYKKDNSNAKKDDQESNVNSTSCDITKSSKNSVDSNGILNKRILRSL